MRDAPLPGLNRCAPSSCFGRESPICARCVCVCSGGGSVTLTVFHRYRSRARGPWLSYSPRTPSHEPQCSAVLKCTVGQWRRASRLAPGNINITSSINVKKKNDVPFPNSSRPCGSIYSGTSCDELSSSSRWERWRNKGSARESSRRFLLRAKICWATARWPCR